MDEPEQPGARRSAGHGQQLLTTVRQDPGHVDISWVRFLLGAAAGEVVDDPERTVVQPYSVVVTAHPRAIPAATLARIRRTGTVGLLHVGDHRYRSRLDAYGDFAFVWRTHLHTSLVGPEVRQLPLGPTVRDPVTAEPLPEAGRLPADRAHTWSHPGDLEGRAVAAMRAALRRVPGGHEPEASPEPDLAEVDGAGGAPPGPGPDRGTPDLGDAVFAPCPMQDGHLETSRIYDALELGCIPIVERRRWLDYFALLLGEHPLPTVRHWDEAPAMIGNLLDDPGALRQRQAQVVAWWTATKHTLAAGAWQDVAACLTGRVNPADEPLRRPPPRWRGRLEALRHLTGRRA